MEFRYHPILEDLKINEDGSEIIYRGEKLNIVKMTRTARKKTDHQSVHFGGRTYSVSRLVCEAWNGLAENIDMYAIRLDNNKGFHYSNLFWAKRGFNPKINEVERKRSSRSKIPESEIPKIVERLKKGEILKTIAAEYNTSDMSISRIKKRYVKN